jgi:hypothetical protein
VEIKIGRVIVTQHIFVINEGEHALVLGQPFSYASQLSYMYENGGQYALLVNPEMTKQVRVRVSVQNKPSLRLEGDVEPENE